MTLAHDPTSDPAERFYAVVRLEAMLSGNPHKQDIVQMLRSLSPSLAPRKNLMDQFYEEVSSAGVRVVKWCESLIPIGGNI